MMRLFSTFLSPLRLKNLLFLLVLFLFASTSQAQCYSGASVGNITLQMDDLVITESNFYPAPPAIVGQRIDLPFKISGAIVPTSEYNSADLTIPLRFVIHKRGTYDRESLNVDFEVTVKLFTDALSDPVIAVELGAADNIVLLGVDQSGTDNVSGTLKFFFPCGQRADDYAIHLEAREKFMETMFEPLNRNNVDDYIETTIAGNMNKVSLHCGAQDWRTTELTQSETKYIAVGLIESITPEIIAPVQGEGTNKGSFIRIAAADAGHPSFTYEWHSQQISDMTLDGTRETCGKTNDYGPVRIDLYVKGNRCMMGYATYNDNQHNCQAREDFLSDFSPLNYPNAQALQAALMKVNQLCNTCPLVELPEQGSKANVSEERFEKQVMELMAEQKLKLSYIASKQILQWENGGDQLGTIKLFDISGRLVEVFSPSTATNYKSLSALDNGIYVAVGSSATGHATTKFVKN